MPYCNHCGRYIEHGTLCNWCEEHAMPTPQPDIPSVAPIEQPTTTPTSSPETHGETPGETTTEEPTVDILPDTPQEGSPPVVEPPQDQTPPPITEKPKKKRYFAAPLRCFDIPNRLRHMLSTPDSTASFSYRDAREGRTMSVLCYLWILWVIPFFSARYNPFVKYHLGQGLMLLLMDCLGATFFGIAWVLSTILPVAAPAFAALGEVALLLACLLKIFGIICALGGKAKELPLVGTYAHHD